ncbi:Cof-type HAD-IIB family hydrolase [Aquibacillus koreensis]|uniref:Cof-type HAD-IIB family hydrolase n=1 Tax=Aquibacillus koreensis TaxID=279446 RepID=A0A9X3WP53_9BACI|nr:Cof-type HAD-IIB family hydrolase [Aquibacillus koreensis]MCT2538172.1 Cof-type HAD-IIB family hydrolase [Aquibacillus koreensis]MDC3420884.1 Cof-type HAD-IIB family hydrolase [Aquibacillus koreensis]
MVLQPKVVFLDMDGTILNHQNKVTLKTVEAIERVRKSGVKVAIATGRSYGEVEEILPPNLVVDGIISSNGMSVHIGKDRLVENTLPIDLVNLIIEKAREKQVYYEVFPTEGPRVTLVEDRPFMEREVDGEKPDDVVISEWLSRKEAIDRDIEWKVTLDSDKFSKFYFFSRTKDKINAWKDELEQIKKSINFTTSISSEHNVEVMVANVNKASGIQYLLDRFGVHKSEVLAIGDSDNDFPMFKLVGHSVAMKNASDRVKQVVDEVTEYTCDEDGVYHYLGRKIAFREGNEKGSQ